MTTIKDIAKTAGVSVTTVSRALNGYSDVNEATRKKIMETARQLNYAPNTIARSLVMKKSKTIGLLVSGFIRESVKDNFMLDVLSGANDYISNTDYDVILFNTNSSKQREKTYQQLCRERQVDGVIIQGIKTDDPYLEEIVNGDTPCVLVDIPKMGTKTGYVMTDNVAGAYDAGKHFIDLGHEKIAMINGHNQAFVSKERLEGFEKALSESGLSLVEVMNGDFTEESGRQCLHDLIQQHPEITAVFCASDLMAIGALTALKELGKTSPDDLSIVGYDDILLARYVTPALTTVSQDIHGLGYEAAKMLVGLLNDEKPDKTIIKHELIIRDSSQRFQ
ncbi:LacI family DNA-binding transcriptional regulator [Jeotgalibacillus haloalkalitolerans]|uniref:LacI family DNA-binding transcriptional regulator n=1 Tax=Jeotgalibacillus haloalkalitolerans TaxID=3104292 RepID=A0ABU5KN97_9BACL|nr:LacI family DNA-binding transcriptional regulator [Jeotgalibacillus sp. HH7-29]MDZ5712729.1 LacI family DNA-binding transcriptional regulator [Jeotgalibacillus sp. HH7-29]